MQKILLIAILIMASLSSCNKANKDGFQIDVNINDIPNGRQVILKKQVDRQVVNVDTTTIENGKFTFKGSIKEPIIFGIFIDSIKRGGLFPFIDVNDHIVITANKDSLQKAKMTGSKLNDELTKMRKKREVLTAESQKYFPEYQKANQEKDTASINRINKAIKKISNKIAANDWDFVKKNPNSYVAPMIFNGLMTNPTYKDSVKIVFNTFSEKIKKSELSKPIRDYFDYLEKQNKPVTPKEEVGKK